MRRGRKFLTFYFMVLSGLSVIAIVPTGALFVLLISTMALPLFGVPGFLVIASPTILIYSAALVPLWLALIEPHRRIWQVAAPACLPVAIAIAIGPGLLSRHDATQFATRMGKDDMSRPAAARPRSIELLGDGTAGMFAGAQAVGDAQAPCNEVCRRLLFNGEADWVRMTRIQDIFRRERPGPPASVTYRLVHRDSCPQLYPDGTPMEKAVRDRLIAGDCLIPEAGGNAVPDARVEFTTRYSDQRYPPAPPDEGPRFATIETVKGLRIESREGGAFAPLVQQTETVARTIALPFYIGSEMHMQGGYNGATIGRVTSVTKPIDLAQAIRDAFGYRIAEISPPPPEDPGRVAERILALPPEATPALSAQQQDALYDVLSAIAKQPSLSDADVAFVRRVIADNRVTEARFGIVLGNMFRKHTARLEPLIPVVLDRISKPVPQQVGHYQSLLGWSLTNYAADSLRLYRDKMVSVVEAQPDWPGDGVLTRLAELGGDDAINLVIQRLDSKSAQFAAIAACRAAVESWPALEPAVLAHLSSPTPIHHLKEDEWPLLLALIRFGKKPLAAEMIERRGLSDKARVLERLAKFEPGFGPEHCRDHL